jgi:hypothetical protein
MKLRLILITTFTLIYHVLFAQNFEPTPVNVIYSYPYEKISYCSFYEFFITGDTELNDPYLLALQGQKQSEGYFSEEDTVESQLQVKSMLTFVWQHAPITLISYTEGANDNLIFNSSKVQELEDGLGIVLQLSNDAFWQFFNSTIDPEYPMINSLKNEVKDSGNILNLKKLAYVIAEHEAELNQYFD